jgi:hypothetical protein
MDKGQPSADFTRRRPAPDSGSDNKKVESALIRQHAVRTGHLEMFSESDIIE